MPAASSMTLGEAVAEVMGRLDQDDDGVANPLLASQVVRQINAAQRMLQREYDLLAKQRKAQLSVAGGQRFVDVPVDAVHGSIQSADWVSGVSRMPLRCGIDRGRRGADPGIPTHYDVSPSSGLVSVDVVAAGSGYTDGVVLATIVGGTRLADGHDPVVELTITAGSVTAAKILDSGSEWSAPPTLELPAGPGTGAVVTATIGGVQLIELNPVPVSSGIMEMTYKAGVVPLRYDDDVLALDDEAVIGKAATLLAAIKNMPIAKSLAEFHLVYMNALRRGHTPGRTTSLSAWRRDDVGTVSIGRH